MSYAVLAVGTVVVLSLFAFAGRLTGFSVMGLWSAGTAYFFMAPVYSFRVSNSRDLAALALYGTVGLVLARTTPNSRRPVRDGPDRPKHQSPPVPRADIRRVLADLTSSSELGERLKERQIEVESSNLDNFRCSYADAVRVLSHVRAAPACRACISLSGRVRTSSLSLRGVNFDLKAAFLARCHGCPVAETQRFQATAEGDHLLGERAPKVGSVTTGVESAKVGV